MSKHRRLWDVSVVTARGFLRAMIHCRHDRFGGRMAQAIQQKKSNVTGVFAGIGGFELGFQRAGFHPSLLCEIDPIATSVLQSRFTDARRVPDVALLTRLPRSQVLTAGFPCQDLSAVGTRKGLDGSKSAVIKVLLDLLEQARSRPEWVVIENVPFMLQLNRGHAMEWIVARLESLGYEWAYRVVDSRSFGLPQRRRRVFLVATNGKTDPSAVIHADDFGPPVPVEADHLACGFYWTEGNTGVGWAVDSIPALKSGSAVSIPSPPAIWMKTTNEIVLPDIRDAERLQGFPANWTACVETDQALSPRKRWKLVGNAVSVPVANWIARRILKPGHPISINARIADSWPIAARGGKRGRWSVEVSEWPLSRRRPHLAAFLAYPTRPISERAAAGFLFRARRSSLRFAPGFLDAVAIAAGERPRRSIKRAA